MSFETKDIKTPEFSYELVTDWRSQKGWPKNYGVLLALAINYYDEMMKKLSESQLEHLNKDNIKKIKTWQRQGLIDPNARGVPINAVAEL